MRSNRVLLSAFHRLVVPATLVLGLTSAAHAQTDKDKPAAAAPPVAAAPVPNKVEGVNVDAPRPAGGFGVPPDKAADYDAQAAKDKAFRDYRKSTPPISSSPTEETKDFPGLQTYIPQK